MVGEEEGWDWVGVLVVLVVSGHCFGWFGLGDEGREGKRWGATLNIWFDEFCSHGVGRDSSEASGRHVYVHGRVKEVSEN